MEVLNADILRLIFRYLDKDELRQCFRVCKSFYSATQNQTFWIDFWKRDRDLKEIKNGDSYIHWREIRNKCKGRPLLNRDYNKIDFNRLELVRVTNNYINNLMRDNTKLYTILYNPVFPDLKSRKITLITPIIDRIRLFTFDNSYTTIKGFYNDKNFDTFQYNLYEYFNKKMNMSISKEKMSIFTAKVGKFSIFSTKEGRRVNREEINQGSKGYMLVEMSMLCLRETDYKIRWNLIELYLV